MRLSLVSRKNAPLSILLSWQFSWCCACEERVGGGIRVCLEEIARTNSGDLCSLCRQRLCGINSVRIGMG